MISPQTSKAVSLLCSSRELALAIGADPIDEPSNLTGPFYERIDGIRAGTVIAVETSGGEYFLWPLRGAA